MGYHPPPPPLKKKKEKIQCTLDISRYLSSKNWEKTTHSSLVRPKHGCILWVYMLNKALFFFFSYCIQYRDISGQRMKANGIFSACKLMTSIFVDKKSEQQWSHIIYKICTAYSCMINLPTVRPGVIVLSVIHRVPQTVYSLIWYHKTALNNRWIKMTFFANWTRLLKHNYWRFDTYGYDTPF